MKQIQDASAGCHHFESDGMPVGITNNQVSAEARQYTRKLGMEAIGKPEEANPCTGISGRRMRDWRTKPAIRRGSGNCTSGGEKRLNESFAFSENGDLCRITIHIGQMNKKG